MNLPYYKQPKIIDTLEQNNLHIYSRPYELNIIGVRSNSQITNKFDDYIYVCFKNGMGTWENHRFNATTDPGMHFINKPMNSNGTAILKHGQYKGTYQIGLHRSKYKALVQRKPVTVYRSKNTSRDIDTKKATQTGQFGINIHHAKGDGTTEDVNRWSAGCQVIANINDFKKLMGFAEQHAKLYGNSFTYTLIDFRTKGYENEVQDTEPKNEIIPHTNSNSN
ncbi:MAG: hypothetical protein JNM95_12065, partial [Chitinophagaceae bacterium]|nr:hypothetical protein [Chitinophagaceae bacterium]